MAVTDRVTTNGAQKAAILLSLMSEEDAAPILRNLPEGDLQRLTDEVSNLPSVPVEVTERYWQPAKPNEDVLDVRATYASFRRFQVTTGEEIKK